MKHDPSNSLETAVWHTYTFMLPFRLGLSDTRGEHCLLALPHWVAPTSITNPWTEEDGDTRFGTLPLVKLRFSTQYDEGYEFEPRLLGNALDAFYGAGAYVAHADTEPFRVKEIYEQWVTIETQACRLQWETDEPYSFHRSLRYRNIFLAAYSIKFGDDQISPVATSELGWIVTRGYRDDRKQWHYDGPILMHPDRMPGVPPERKPQERAADLSNAIESVVHNHPYVDARLWFDKAKRRERDGDHDGCIVALQVSFESMMYATWQMTMVDQGLTSDQITSRLASRTVFESLFKTTIPRLLGGSWDRKKFGTPVYDYWHHLYLVRNRIIHRGEHVGPGDAERAIESYRKVRSFLNDQLWSKRYSFPRTMLARIGNPGGMGYASDRRTDDICEKLRNEVIWWLPVDVRGKPKDTKTAV